MTMLRRIRIALWILVAAAAGGAALLAAGLVSLPRTEQMGGGTGIAQIGGPFRLTSHTGQPVTDADVRGKPFLVFFGFTNCPDVCPTTLGALSVRYQDLGPDADKLTSLFITVDPERDTQALLSEYMTAFDPRIVALRGTEAETEAVARAFKVFYRKVPLDGGGYTMDHNAIVYMMDRNGQFAGSLDPHEDEATQIGKLRRLIAG